MGVVEKRGLAKDDLSSETIKRSKNDNWFFKIRPSSTTSKEGLKTFDIHLETTRI